ncbi:potassium/proton antiporter [Paenibacillus sp. TRM 82003]|nr:potassium/proton antiporter [Paenibacillus sp. TRM 82003]
MFTTDNAILLVSVLLLVGVLTAKFSSRFGLPSLVFFIGVGMVLSHYIYYDDAQLTQLVGILALIIILFEGGLQTKWKQVRSVIAPSLSLATAGVLLTSLLVGLAAMLILNVTFLEGMLFGAIVGSTDAAAVFAALGNKNIKKRLTSTLEAESGTNDPMAVFLTISLIQLIQSPDLSLFVLAGYFALQMGVGLLMGFIVGKAAVWSINKINLDSSGLYPVLSVAFAVLTYGFTASIHGSGLLAVYVMAMVLGNSDLTYRHSIVRFNEGFAWMMQITMFILLGLLVFPAQLVEVAWQGIALSLILMLVARPVGVLLSTVFMKFTLAEKTLIAWAGLRGAVPIVLATYPIIAGLENGMLFFNVVFFVVLTSALVQGATISPLAAKLGLVGEKKTNVPHTLELVSIGKTNMEMLEIAVEEGAPAAHLPIQRMTLPPDALITAVIRGDQMITPRGNTDLLPGDVLYIMMNKANRSAIKSMFTSARREESEVQQDG